MDNQTLDIILRDIFPVFGSMIFAWIAGNAKARMTQKNAEYKSIKEGLQAVLRQDILLMTKEHTKLGYADEHDRESMHAMFESYKGLGGNGMVAELYKKF